MFQAYEIDGLRPVAEQTIGFKCVEGLDEAARTCTRWEACGEARGRRCNFGEFFHFSLDGNNDQDWARWSGRPPAETRLDVEATAENCYTRFKNSHNRVPDFKPYNTVKNVYEFNEMVRTVGKSINDAWSRHMTPANRYLWEDWDDTLDKIRISRVADHGRQVLGRAHHDIGRLLTALHTESLGPNPNPDFRGELREIIDWKRTAVEARARLEYDILRQFSTNYYYGGGRSATARKHLAVIRSYKRVADSSRRCRRFRALV